MLLITTLCMLGLVSTKHLFVMQALNTVNRERATLATNSEVMIKNWYAYAQNTNVSGIPAINQTALAGMFNELYGVDMGITNLVLSTATDTGGVYHSPFCSNVATGETFSKYIASFDMNLPKQGVSIQGTQTAKVTHTLMARNMGLGEVPLILTAPVVTVDVTTPINIANSKYYIRNGTITINGSTAIGITASGTLTGKFYKSKLNSTSLEPSPLETGITYAYDGVTVPTDLQDCAVAISLQLPAESTPKNRLVLYLGAIAQRTEKNLIITTTNPADGIVLISDPAIDSYRATVSDDPIGTPSLPAYPASFYTTPITLSTNSNVILWGNMSGNYNGSGHALVPTVVINLTGPATRSVVAQASTVFNATVTNPLSKWHTHMLSFGNNGVVLDGIGEPDLTLVGGIFSSTQTLHVGAMNLTLLSNNVTGLPYFKTPIKSSVKLLVND